MRKNKKAVSIVLCMLLTLTLFAGCGKKEPDPKPSGDTISDVGNTEEKPNTNTKNTANNKKKPEIAIKFANALCDEDYQTILDMLYLPENSIVAATDIETFLKRSNLASFIGSDCIEVTKANETETAILTEIKSNNDTCEVNFELNEDRNFALQMANAYIEKDVLAPGNAAIRINGISLDNLTENYATQYEKADKGLLVYHLYCPVTDFTANVSTSIDDYEITVPYDANAKLYDILNYNLNEETLTNACNGLKQAMNGFLTDLHAGKTNTNELNQYFVTDIDPTFITNLVNWYGTKAMPTDCQIEIMQPSDKENEPCYIITDDSIRLFTRYKTTWNAGAENAHIYSSFTMTLDKGTWKIKDTDIMKTGNFICNPFQHDWSE